MSGPLVFPKKVSLKSSRWVAFLTWVACAPAQVITTVAGTDFSYPTQPLPALSAPLGSVQGVAVDGAGNIYISDLDNHLVSRMSPNGAITVVAGNGIAGFSGDG